MKKSTVVGHMKGSEIAGNPGCFGVCSELVVLVVFDHIIVFPYTVNTKG